MNVQYDKNMNAILIPTDWIIPKNKEIKLSEVFKMSYEDRINRFATDDQKKEIMIQMNKYPGCKITEYCDAY